MAGAMIYGERPNFEKLIDVMKVLEDLFHNHKNG